MRKHSVHRLVPAATAALALCMVGAGAASAQAAPRERVVGHVYEATNAAAGNAVQVFDRTADGRLTPAALVPTGHPGLGASLASQNAVVRDGDLLYVVNGGDDTVTTLAITRRGLVVRDTESSGGDRPVSVTVRRGLVYVLNQTDATISGLTVDRSGDLTPVPGSTRALSTDGATPPTATAAAQVSFSPDGRSLVVTHKGDRAIDTFAVRGSTVGTAVRNESSGVTPYGFDFDRRGNVIVSEAGSGAVSSYALRGDRLGVISASVPDTQAAACWLVVSRDGRTAWTVNAASSTISSYRIAGDGSLSLLEAVAARTTGGGTDVALAPDGGSLHVRLADGSVSSWDVARDGGLTFLGTARGAATSGTAGLAAD